MQPLTVLAVRDPDGGVEVRVWIANTEVTQDSRIVVIDAGAGHEMSDWMDTARSYNNPIWVDPNNAIQDAFRNPPGSQYIRGWIDVENVDRQWVDTSLTNVDGLPTVLTMDECEWLGLDGTGRTT